MVFCTKACRRVVRSGQASVAVLVWEVMEVFGVHRAVLPVHAHIEMSVLAESLAHVHNEISKEDTTLLGAVHTGGEKRVKRGLRKGF